MFSNKTRIVLGSIALLIAVFFAIAGGWLQMSAAIVFLLWIGVGYFTSGTVFLALRRFSRNDFESAEKLLKMTRYPKYLAGTQKAYYHLIAGLIEARKGNYILASSNLESALAKGLRTSNDKTIACLNLSIVNYNLGNQVKARKYFTEAKALNKNPKLQPEIDELAGMMKE